MVFLIVAEQNPDRAEIIIPPRKDAVYHDDNYEKRNQNIFEIAFGYGGRMGWQWQRHYGRKNYSELAIQRYKRILGNQLQSR